jgi:Domain of unknown function (DUF4505)
MTMMKGQHGRSFGMMALARRHHHQRGIHQMIKRPRYDCVVVVDPPHLHRYRFSSSTSSTTTSTTTTYIDHWFNSIRKPSTFYDEAANGQPRRYFYNVDLQGRLFLEETKPKNIATSIKDEKFLNFFFERVQPITNKQRQYLIEKSGEGEGFQYHYPFVSLCGQEINYIRPAATPIVFHSLLRYGGGKDSNNHERKDHHHRQHLLFGGSIPVDFDSNSLVISKVNGRLYHPLVLTSSSAAAAASSSDYDETLSSKTKKQQQKINESRDQLGYGLIRSSIAVTLSDRIHHCDTTDDDRFMYESEDGTTSLIGWLPSYFEPGSWAMPDDDMNDNE